MRSTAFRIRTRAKRHEHVLEAYAELPVDAFLGYLPVEAWGTPGAWELPRERLVLERRRCGRALRWFMYCGACGRRCESLFAHPTARTGPWRCRRCWGWPSYASQRWKSLWLPLRRKPTHRKRKTLQRVIAAQERVIRRHDPRVEAVDERAAAEYDVYITTARERILIHLRSGA